MKKEQEIHESDLIFRVQAKAKRKARHVEFTLKPKDISAKVFKEAMSTVDEVVSVEWTHRHYSQDDEYIPHGEDIVAFLEREIAKPIIRWTDSEQLGYEILPNSDYVDSKLAEFGRVVTCIQSQITTLTNYRKSLIHECVKGQRRITEADLNRVKAHG